MNSIIQHLPSFVEGMMEKQAWFNSLDELFNVPWIKRWSDSKDFHRFSKSGELLVAEFKSGKIGYVVGTLVYDVPELPEWRKQQRKGKQ